LGFDEAEAKKSPVLTESAEPTDREAMQDKARKFANMVISRNGIKIGEPIGDKLDDPLLELIIDPDDYEKPPENMHQTVRYILERSMTLYVDEYSTLKYNRLPDRFWRDWGEVAENVKAMALLINKISQPPYSGKMEFDEFLMKCCYYYDNDKDMLRISAESVAEDLARILEKNGILKFRGDRVKWKGRD